MAEWFRPLVDSVEIDPLYNVIACKKATLPTPDGSPAPKVLLCAHQDEIALMVNHIEDDGAVRFANVGGVDPRILPSLEVEIQGRKGPVYGVIGSRPPPVQTPDEQQKAIKSKNASYSPVKKLNSMGDEIMSRLGFWPPAGEIDLFNSKYANKKGAKYTLIIGDSEIDAGVAQLKNMTDGSYIGFKYFDLFTYKIH